MKEMKEEIREMKEQMNKYLLDNAVDGQFVVIADCSDGQVIICKDGRISFELEDAVDIRDDHRELCKSSGIEVNVYMVQHGMDDYGQIINELIKFE